MYLATTEEAARQTGLDESFLRKLLRAGRLRGQKRGRDWDIPQDEVDRLAKEYAGKNKRGPK